MIQPYNYILETYPMKRDTIYPVSRKSDLKKVYNDIVSLSKRSPFYKINLSRENQQYTFGVKETALALKAKINDMTDPEVSGFQTKAVAVSDDTVISADLLGEKAEGLPEYLELKVNSLATVQINRGRELLNTSRGLPPGNYEFSASIGDDTYDLIFYQEGRQENLETLKNMADFLNQKLSGINAVVDKGSSKDYSNLTIISDMSGRYGDKRFGFTAEDEYNIDIVEFFGMNRMEAAPDFAHFDLNGVPKQTATNAFTLENSVRISLFKSSEEPVRLTIASDSEKILSAVNNVLSTYNNLIELAKNRTMENHEHYKATKLMSEMKSLELVYSEELEACGFKASEDGFLSLEEPLASQAAADGGMESLFMRENGFIARLLDKTDSIAINPMEYLDKTIVTYPNTEKDVYHNPYVTSMYSGMFFSSYC